MMGGTVRAWRRFLAVAALGLTLACPALAEEAVDKALPERCAFLPADFGVVERESLAIDAANQQLGDLYLRAKILRYEAVDQPATLTSDAGKRTVAYRDIVLLFHRPEAEVLPILKGIVSALEAGGAGRVIASADCDFRDEKRLRLFEPFVDVSDLAQKTVEFSKSVVVLTRDVQVAIEPQPFTRMPPTLDAIGTLLDGLGEGTILPPAGDQASVPTEAPVEPPPPVTWQRNFYPWVVDLDFADPAPGEEVFALDRIQCDKVGNFIVGAIGTIALPEQREAPSQDELPVVRQQMIAANLYFGSSGDPTNQDAVVSSVDETAYWCIPKQELCYQKVEFGDFGIRAKINDINEFRIGNVVSLRNGLVMAMQRIVMDNCPQQTVQGK